jgi:aspartokinase
MNISSKILKIMGLNIAEKLIENNQNPDIRIWRAVISLALEDVMITNQNRTESVLKGDAHDWFCSDSEDFNMVCFQAELEPKWVRMRYLDALEKGVIKFTNKQNLNIKYTKQYEKLRAATDKDQRRKINKVIDQLRKAIFECTD